MKTRNKLALWLFSAVSFDMITTYLAFNSNLRETNKLFNFMLIEINPNAIFLWSIFILGLFLYLEPKFKVLKIPFQAVIIYYIFESIMAGIGNILWILS